VRGTPVCLPRSHERHPWRSIDVRTGDEIVLMKHRIGRIIGFEKLNFAPADPRNVAFDFETVGV
jgi:hypothetical protein